MNINIFRKNYIIIKIAVLSVLFFFSNSIFYAIDEPSVSDKYVFDYTNSIDEQKLEELNSEYRAFVKKNKSSLYYVITRDVGEKTIEKYAEDIFDNLNEINGFDNQGMILAIDLKNRDYTIRTKGDSYRNTMDVYLDVIVDMIYDSLSSGYYDKVGDILVTTVNEVYERNDENYTNDSSQDYSNNNFSTNEEYYDNLSDFQKYIMKIGYLLKNPVTYIISFVLTMLIIVYLLRNHKGEISVNSTTYEKSGSFDLRNREDIFLYRNVTRSAKPKSNNRSFSGGSGGSGGSFGGRSGKF